MSLRLRILKIFMIIINRLKFRLTGSARWRYTIFQIKSFESVKLSYLKDCVLCRLLQRNRLCSCHLILARGALLFVSVAWPDPRPVTLHTTRLAAVPLRLSRGSGSALAV